MDKRVRDVPKETQDRRLHTLPVWARERIKKAESELRQERLIREAREKDVAGIVAEWKALREPTEEMIVAGVNTLLTGHDSQRHYVADLSRRMFDAAIDALLKERT